jgi:hypothetical protein
MGLPLALLAVAIVGLAGSVGFPPPASRWLLAFAAVAGALLTYIAIASVLDSPLRRDARRRANFRGPR